MNEQKKHFWQEPDWDCLSPRRKYPWKLNDYSDYQDILSTWECLTPESEDLKQSNPDATQTE